MSTLSLDYAAGQSRRRAARMLGVPLAEYLDRTAHGHAWCRRHKGWVARPEMGGKYSGANSGICRTCYAAGKEPISRARAELLDCISRRGTATEPGDRMGQTLGEADWAAEMRRNGEVLPEEFGR